MREQRASWFELGVGGILTAVAVWLLFSSARKVMSAAAGDSGVESFIVIGFFGYTLLIVYLALKVAMKESGE